MTQSLKQQTKKGLVWSSIENFSVKGVSFVITIVMARLLTPEHYGLIGMLTIFMAVAQSLIDSGFSQALIRKIDRTEVDNSTVFYFNIAVGFVLYLLLFVTAPLVAKFYDTPQLCPIMRVLCLSVIINSFAVVQRALLTIQIDFKTQAKASLIASITSGVIGIGMAYKGYGVWAIVGQQLTNYGFIVILLWIFSKWRPRWVYSWQSFRELFAFGSKMLAAGLLDTVYNNIYLIAIGKFYAAGPLGHYTRAHQFATFPSANLTGIMQRVTYPILCHIQNDDMRLANTYRRFLKASAFIIFPLMCGLAAVSEPLVLVVLGEKWHQCAVLLEILCFVMMWYPIHAINLNLLQVKGRSDLFLRLEIIKKIIGVSILIITLPYGLVVMCYAQIISSILCLGINTYYTGKLINVGFARQMLDLLPTLLLSLAMFAVTFFICNLFTNLWVKLAIGIPTGMAVFIIVSLLLHFPEWKELQTFMPKKHKQTNDMQ